MTETPVRAVADVEPDQDHAGVQGRPEQVRCRQPLDVETSTNGPGYHDEHQDSLDEIPEDEIEARAQDEGPRHQQDHPYEERHQPFGCIDPDESQPPVGAPIHRIERDGEKARDDGRVQQLERWEQLMHATHRGQDVTRDACDPKVPVRVRRYSRSD